jgi:hypothetical protein
MNEQIKLKIREEAEKIVTQNMQQFFPNELLTPKRKPANYRRSIQSYIPIQQKRITTNHRKKLILR